MASSNQSYAIFPIKSVFLNEKELLFEQLRMCIIIMELFGFFFLLNSCNCRNQTDNKHSLWILARWFSVGCHTQQGGKKIKLSFFWNLFQKWEAILVVGTGFWEVGEITLKVLFPLSHLSLCIKNTWWKKASVLCGVCCLNE